MGRRMSAARAAAALLVAGLVAAGCANPLLNVVKDTALKTTASPSSFMLMGAGGAEIPLSPAFSPDTLSYRAMVNRAIGTIAIHADLSDAGAQWKVNNRAVTSKGVAVSLALGDNVIPIEVNSASGLVQKKYTLTVTRGIFKAVTGGYAYFVLKGDGTLWAWGSNGNAQLGDGTQTNRMLPARVSGIIDVVSVESKNAHTVALKSDGTVWAWGAGWNGRLGNGDWGDQYVPTQVTGLKGVIAIAAGWNHSMALKNDGTVWTWGANGNGQLGDGTTTESNVPLQVPGLSHVVAIAAGDPFSLALVDDGTVWAWGGNGNGQLGDGMGSNQLSPVQVSGLTGVKAITAGQNHSLALKNDETVWAWGYNTSWLGYIGGQIGDGTTKDSLSPVQVAGLAGVAAISASYGHSMALKNDGTVWAWGENWQGQLGDHAALSRLTPVAVHLPSVVLLGTATNGTLAVTADDRLYFWGQDWDPSKGIVSTPVRVTGLSDVTAVAAGGFHSMALKNDGTVWTWGDGFCGQLGNPITTDMLAPQQVYGLSGVTAVGAGWIYSAALKNDGTVWTWGTGKDTGQLGDGTAQNSPVPVKVSGLSGVTAVQYGGHFGLALKNDNTIWGWGLNWGGQLGDNTTANRWAPVQVTGLTGAPGMKIAGGEGHSIALVGGEIWSWGNNWAGQIGDGTTNDAHVPVKVSGLAGMTEVAAGQRHSIALKNDGTVWTWGGNNSGQLGNGTFADSRTPVLVAGLSNVTAISAGYDFSIALRSDGTVWAWGANNTGQLGNGSTTNRNTPAQVNGLSGVIAIDSGNCGHSLAVESDGSVWAWGSGMYGQIGNGFTSLQYDPAEVTLP